MNTFMNMSLHVQLFHENKFLLKGLIYERKTMAKELVHLKHGIFPN